MLRVREGCSEWIKGVVRERESQRGNNDVGEGKVVVNGKVEDGRRMEEGGCEKAS